MVLLVLDRASFKRLQQQAQAGDAVASAAVQSVIAAACRPLLQVSSRARTTVEVETLADLFSGLEVRRTPSDSRADGVLHRVPNGGS